MGSYGQGGVAQWTAAAAPSGATQAALFLVI